MSQAATLPQYVAFVYEYYKIAEKIQAAGSGAVQAEFSRHPPNNQQSLLELVGHVNAMNTQISQYHNTLLANREAICLDWHENDEDQHDNDRKAIDNQWDTLIQRCQYRTGFLNRQGNTLAKRTEGFRRLLLSLQRLKDVSWEGKSVGEGGQGAATVYTLSDDKTGRIFNRVVVKDSQYKKNDFRDPQDWHAPGITGIRVPCCETPGSPHVLWEKMMARLYMEFAPNGDGEKIIMIHDEHGEPIPEVFLWLVFRALVKTTMIMQNGGVHGEIAGQQWSQIVHCDLKAANLFLGTSDKDYFPQYPTLKLGDFGVAFPTNDSDATNPIMWSERGTEGHWAPEQLYWVDSITKEPLSPAAKILSPCNTYGIGTILLQLMERRQYLTPQQAVWPELYDGSETNSDDGLILHDAVKDLYSKDLSDYVEMCLRGEAKDRPSLSYLLGKIEAKLDGDDLEKERGGWTDPEGDTLLLPNTTVNLKWASRLDGGGLDSEGNRKPRVQPAAPGGDSSLG